MFSENSSESEDELTTLHTSEFSDQNIEYSYRSIYYYERNIKNSTINMLHNLNNEYQRVLQQKNRIPEWSDEIENRINGLLAALENFLKSFRESVKKKSLTVLKQLRHINEMRKNYNFEQAQYDRLSTAVTQSADGNRYALSHLDHEIESLRKRHNVATINYNKEIMILQLQLTNYKRGIATVAQSFSSPSGETYVPENIVLFYKWIDEIRGYYRISGETPEEAADRDAEVNAWQRDLELPSNIILSQFSPRPDVYSFGTGSFTSPDQPPFASPSQPPSTPRSRADEPGSPFPMYRPDEPGPSTPRDRPDEPTPSTSRYRPDEPGPSTPRYRPDEPSSPQTPSQVRRRENQKIITDLKTKYEGLRRRILQYTTSSRSVTDSRDFNVEIAEVETLMTDIKNIRNQIKRREGPRETDPVRRTRDEDAPERPPRETERRLSYQYLTVLIQEIRDLKVKMRPYLKKIDDHLKTILEYRDLMVAVQNEEDVSEDELLVLHESIQAKLLPLNEEIIEWTSQISTIEWDIFEKETALSHKILEFKRRLENKRDRLNERLERLPAADSD